MYLPPAIPTLGTIKYGTPRAPPIWSGSCSLRSQAPASAFRDQKWSLPAIYALKALGRLHLGGEALVEQIGERLRHTVNGIEVHHRNTLGLGCRRIGDRRRPHHTQSQRNNHDTLVSKLSGFCEDVAALAKDQNLIILVRFDRQLHHGVLA